jgi:hypothetical protein
MRVVFFDAAHARLSTENIFSFPIYATCSSRILEKSAGTEKAEAKAEAQMEKVRSSLTLDLSLVHLLRTIERMTSNLFVV